MSHYQRGVACYQRGELDAALELFRQHVALHPQRQEGHISVGVILQEQGQHEAAIESFRRAVALQPDADSHVKLGIALRKLRSQGHDVQEAQEYEEAIRLDPHCASAFTNLADVRLFQGDFAAARSSIEQALTLTGEEPQHRHTRALTYFFSGQDEQARRELQESNRLAIDRWDEQLGARGSAGTRRWFAVPATKRELFPDVAGTTYGNPHPQTLAEPTAIRPQLTFREPNVYLVTLRGVYLEGLHGLAYTDDEVFASQHVMIQGVWRFFTEAGPQHPRETIKVAKLASLHQPDCINYYHWTAECLTRALLLESVLAEDAATRLLVPRQTAAPTIHESLQLLGLPASQLELNRAGRKRRYFVEELHYVDWQWPVTQSPSDELAATWYPPREGLQRLRRRLAEPHPPTAERRAVVYLSRPDPQRPRSVLGETALIAALREVFAEDLVVFAGKDQTLAEQIELFRHARLVIGPHGAGLVNILFCAPGTQVLEFPVIPSVLNHFAHLAAALDLEYWVSKDVSTHYLGCYRLDDHKVRSVIRALAQIVG